MHVSGCLISKRNTYRAVEFGNLATRKGIGRGGRRSRSWIDGGCSGGDGDSGGRVAGSTRWTVETGTFRVWRSNSSRRIRVSWLVRLVDRANIDGHEMFEVIVGRDKGVAILVLEADTGRVVEAVEVLCRRDDRLGSVVRMDEDAQRESGPALCRGQDELKRDLFARALVGGVGAGRAKDGPRAGPRMGGGSHGWEKKEKKAKKKATECDRHTSSSRTESESTEAGNRKPIDPAGRKGWSKVFFGNVLL